MATSILTSRRGTLRKPSSLGLPTVTSGTLAGHWKADAITGLSNGASIVSWPDSSGNSITMTATGTATTYQTNVLNGLPAVRFAGTSGNYLSCTSGVFSFSQPITLFFVAKRATAAGVNEVVVSNNNAASAFWWFSGTQTFSAYFNNQGDTAPATLTVPHVFESIASGASSTLGIDSVGSGFNLSTNPLAGLTFGAAGVDKASRLTGDIYEVVIYSGALSTGDRSLVRAYLGAKYGITVT